MTSEPASTTADIVLTLEGAPGSAETVNVKKDSPIQQVLATWLRQRGLDPGPWRLLKHSDYSPRSISTRSEAIPVKDTIKYRQFVDVAPDDTTATEEERKRGRKERDVPLIDMTVSFRGIELPAAIAPLRLAACNPDARRASSDTVDAVFSTYLEHTILPFALGQPLDAARAALVAKPWAAGIQGWFGSPHWCKVFGLGEHFNALAEAAVALSMLKAFERPSPELDAAFGKKYSARVKVDNFYGDEDDDECMAEEDFTLRVGKLTGLPFTFLPFTFLWRKCSFTTECSWSSDMLAMGSNLAAGGGGGGAGGRLRYHEICSSLTGEMEGTRLNLQAFLLLRALVRERFPAATQLSDMQLLLLLTCATLPMPLTRDDVDVLDAVAEQFAHVKRMSGHPQAPEAPAQPARHWCWESEPGVPSGMDQDNSGTGDTGYRYVDGLPIGTTLTKEFRAHLDPMLSLVTQFHLGPGR